MAGTAPRALTTAQAIRCVKLTLPPVVRAELIVDHGSVDLEKLGGNGVNAGGGRHGEAGAHVLDDAGRGASKGHGDLVGREEPPRSRRRAVARQRRAVATRSGRRRPRRPSAGAWARSADPWLGELGGASGGSSVPRPVVGEELTPALADRLGISEVGLVHLLDEPGVCPVGAREPVTARSVCHQARCLPAADMWAHHVRAVEPPVGPARTSARTSVLSVMIAARAVGWCRPECRPAEPAREH